MGLKVSIIVPVYNAQKYLSRCLDSLMAQSLDNIEIIAVNDGSTDKSLDILNDYAKRDTRLVVVDQQNNGVSSARNAGIKAAKGDFIGFVDADDWVDSNMYEQMYDVAVGDTADMVMCSYVREFDSHAKVKNFNLPKKVYYHNEEVRSKVLRRLVGPLNEETANPEFLDAWGTVWSKLYRANIIRENNIQFTDLNEIGTNEDLLFNIYASYFSRNFVFINQPYYHYWRMNEGSFTSGYNPNLVHQWFRLFNHIESFLQEKKMGPEYFLALNNRICIGILGLGLNTISKMNRAPVPAKISHLKRILGDERIKCAFERFDLSYFSLHWRMFYFCARYRFTEGLFIMLVAINYLRQMVR